MRCVVDAENVDVDFSKALQRCIDQIRPGRAASCGQVARALGDGRAARAVATWIVSHPDMPGAHRVVRADGRPVLPTASRQLSQDGIRLLRGLVPSERIAEELNPIGFLTALRAEQQDLSNRVVERSPGLQVESVAGVDAGYDGDLAHVVATRLDFRSLSPIEVTVVKSRAEFPYIPTYLAYREFPGIEEAVGRLHRRPSVLLVDGHGRLHPALFGVACYVGVRLDLPTIGVAKHPLVGRLKRGGRVSSGATPVEFEARIRGYMWTPPGRERPIFISIGHRISLDRALEIVQASTVHGYPEPLRIADRIGRETKRNGRNEKREKGATR